MKPELTDGGTARPDGPWPAQDWSKKHFIWSSAHNNALILSLITQYVVSGPSNFFMVAPPLPELLKGQTIGLDTGLNLLRVRHDYVKIMHITYPLNPQHSPTAIKLFSFSLLMYTTIFFRFRHQPSGSFFQVQTNSQDNIEEENTTSGCTIRICNMAPNAGLNMWSTDLWTEQKNILPTTICS